MTQPLPKSVTYTGLTSLRDACASKNKFVQVASLPDLHQLNQWTSIYPKRGEKAEEREIPWHHMFAQLPKSKVGENQFQHFSFKKLLFLLSANSAGGKI